MFFPNSLLAGFLAAAALAAIGPAAADDLSGSELRALLASKTIYVSAPFGTLPIRYSPNGTMAAQSTAMGIYCGGISEDRGTWRIGGNQFCQRWKVWNSGKE